jgi:hypothetical protein
MSYRKGEETKRSKNRDYPFQVEIDVPEGGLGRRLDELYAAASDIAPDHRKSGRRDGIRDWALWCFKSQDEADRFHEKCGGRRLVVTPNRRRSFDFKYLD